MSYRKSVAVTAGVLAVWLVVLAAVAINRPLWGDEEHYVQAIDRFGHHLSLELLRTYEGELAPPLPFLMYAGWGRLAGFELSTLRVFSLLIAFATLLVWHRFFVLMLGKPAVAMGLTLFLAVHPYNAGLSVFVFNDMVAMLFVALAAVAFIRGRALEVAVWLALALLSRQFMAFVVMAAGGVAAARWWLARRPDDFRLAAAVALSVVPLLALMWFWQGPGPDNEARHTYLQHGMAYKMPGLMLYLSLLTVYLAPVFVFWRVPFGKPSIAAFVLVVATYGLWPVVAAEAQLAVGITTAGFLHRVVSALLPPIVQQAFWALTAGGGAALTAALAIRGVDALRRDDHRGQAFVCLTLLAFLILMPFSYMYWEKYFMPVLPFALIAIVMSAHKQTAIASWRPAPAVLQRSTTI